MKYMYKSLRMKKLRNRLEASITILYERREEYKWVASQNRLNPRRSIIVKSAKK